MINALLVVFGLATVADDTLSSTQKAIGQSALGIGLFRAVAAVWPMVEERKDVV